MPPGTVLVTGASGYVGAAVALALIQKGYRVRCTTRSEKKAAAFMAKHQETNPHVEWSIVPDGVQRGAWEAAVNGVDYICHTASPFHYRTVDNERDMLLPAIEGTKNLLAAAAKEPRVKHVVLTSSMAAMVDLDKGANEGHTYDSDDWNPVTWEDAVTSESGLVVYFASKKFSEKAAWDFMKTEKPGFYLTAICPPLIFGPPYQPIQSMDDLNQSIAEVWDLISGKHKEVPPTLLPVWTDVRDVAQLHVDALSNPLSRNQRYLTVAGHYSNAQTAHIVAKAIPSEAARIPPSDNSPPGPHYGTDSSKAERDFGIKWLTFEQSIVDTAKALYALERELKPTV